MKQRPIDNPLFAFSLAILTIFINIISSVHFLPILLAGIVFLVLKQAIENKYYYSASYMIVTFLFIEFNNGFMPFSLTLLSFFLYIFIIPNLTRFISLHNLNNYIFIFTFYLTVSLMWVFTNGFDILLVKSIIFNIFLDMLIFGIFL